jgi:hypothetical protein
MNKLIKNRGDKVPLSLSLSLPNGITSCLEFMSNALSGQLEAGAANPEQTVGKDGGMDGRSSSPRHNRRRSSQLLLVGVAGHQHTYRADLLPLACTVPLDPLRVGSATVCLTGALAPLWTLLPVALALLQP